MSHQAARCLCSTAHLRLAGGPVASAPCSPLPTVSHSFPHCQSPTASHDRAGPRQHPWELREARGYWNLHKRTSKSTTRDKRARGALLRPDSAGTVIEGFLLLSVLSKPDPKENTVKAETKRGWQCGRLSGAHTVEPKMTWTSCARRVAGSSQDVRG